MDAIKESAFKTSDYPVMVSIEQHCHRAAQRRMASDIRETWGTSEANPDLLVARTNTRNPVSQSWTRKQFNPFREVLHTDLEQHNFPSPHELRNKVRMSCSCLIVCEYMGDDNVPATLYPKVQPEQP